jgi:hypothetical protein
MELVIRITRSLSINSKKLMQNFVRDRVFRRALKHRHKILMQCLHQSNSLEQASRHVYLKINRSLITPKNHADPSTRNHTQEDRVRSFEKTLFFVVSTVFGTGCHEGQLYQVGLGAFKRWIAAIRRLIVTISLSFWAKVISIGNLALNNESDHRQGNFNQSHQIALRDRPHRPRQLYFSISRFESRCFAV